MQIQVQRVNCWLKDRRLLNEFFSQLDEKCLVDGLIAFVPSDVLMDRLDESSPLKLFVAFRREKSVFAVVERLCR